MSWRILCAKRGETDKRTTEWVAGPRRSARPKSSMAWRSCSAILPGILVTQHSTLLSETTEQGQAHNTHTPTLTGRTYRKQYDDVIKVLTYFRGTGFQTPPCSVR